MAITIDIEQWNDAAKARNTRVDMMTGQRWMWTNLHDGIYRWMLVQIDNMKHNTMTIAQRVRAIRRVVYDLMIELSQAQEADDAISRHYGAPYLKPRTDRVTARFHVALDQIDLDMATLQSTLHEYAIIEAESPSPWTPDAYDVASFIDTFLS